MTLAALVLLVFFPTAITLAALSPVNSEGAGAFVIQNMGLSGDAAAAVERLFVPHGGTVLSRLDADEPGLARGRRVGPGLHAAGDLPADLGP